MEISIAAPRFLSLWKNIVAVQASTGTCLRWIHRHLLHKGCRLPQGCTPIHCNLRPERLAADHLGVLSTKSLSTQQHSKRRARNNMH